MNDYGLDGPGIESRWGEIFRSSRPALRPTLPPVKWVPLLPGGKVRLERAACHSPPSSAVVLEEQSYTSTHPLGHNRACNVNTLPLLNIPNNTSGFIVSKGRMADPGNGALSSVNEVSRLLGMWVRIPPGAWMSALCECSVLSGRSFCDELIPCSEECCVLS